MASSLGNVDVFHTDRLVQPGAELAGDDLAHAQSGLPWYVHLKGLAIVRLK